MVVIPYGIDIQAVQETELRRIHIIEIKDDLFCIIYIKLQGAENKFSGISGCTCKIYLKIIKENIILINIHILMEDKEEEIKDKFYENLKK